VWVWGRVSAPPPHHAPPPPTKQIAPFRQLTR
jgi:hypothetical protein